MIEWFTWVLCLVSAAAGLFCIIAGATGRKPGDVTVGAVALVELLLVVQFVIALVAPALGNQPVGDALEFWMYWVVAIIIPPAAVFWGLVERTKWSTVILGVAALTIGVMVFRMHQIWIGASPFVGGPA